jgi:hypothetical protein
MANWLLLAQGLGQEMADWGSCTQDSGSISLAFYSGRLDLLQV